jgi:hypothetical protein
MSSWARVGVKCVCAFVPEKADTYDVNLPQEGEAYTIRGIEMFGGHVGVVLDEIQNAVTQYADGIGEVLFDVRMFKPLISQADDVAMFRKLVETMKPTERLDALREMLDQ